MINQIESVYTILPAHNHDGVVQRPLCLGHELLGAAAEDDGARLALGNPAEEVEPLASDLNDGEMSLEIDLNDINGFANSHSTGSNEQGC